MFIYEQMNKKEWLKVIRDACEQAGTYSEEYESVIDTLAGIMEIRDAAQKQYEMSGSNPVVSYTNKAGHTNLRKNPALQVITDQNAAALAYWRDLGLTPAGFKKLDGAVIKKTGKSFEEVLSGIGL